MDFCDGVLKSPFFVTIYGSPGVGKSSLCSYAPAPLFLDLENGTKKLDVKRVSNFNDYSEVIKLVDAAISGEKEKLNEYKTFVFDSIDILEHMIHDDICKKNSKKIISDFAFGKGFELVHEAWFELFNKLNILRDNQNKNIIFIAHEQVKKFENPMAESYDRFNLKINQRISNFIFSKCDAVFFMSKAFVLKNSIQNNDRKIPVSLPGRIIYTQETASIIAKNRYGLEPEIKIYSNSDDEIKFFERLF